MDTAASVLSIVAALLAIIMVRRLTQRQKARTQRIAETAGRVELASQGA
jgi:membrane protein implicated in regulation of membrane protease activity